MPHWRVTGLLVCTCWHLCHNETERPARCSETHLNRQIQVDSVFGLNIKLKPEDYYSLWLRAASKSTLCQTDWLWTLFLCNEDCVGPSWALLLVHVALCWCFCVLSDCFLSPGQMWSLPKVTVQENTVKKRSPSHPASYLTHNKTSKPNWVHTQKEICFNKKIYFFHQLSHKEKIILNIFFIYFFIWLVEKNHPEKMILSWIFLFIIFFCFGCTEQIQTQEKNYS